MANRKIEGVTYSGAVIDTAPGASGYWSNPVSSHEHHVGKLIFSISGIFAATVTLQFKDVFGTWTDYDTYTDKARLLVEDYTVTQWRAGVKNTNFTSGAVRVVLEFHNGESS